MSVLDHTTTAQPAADVQADADALLLSRRVRVYLSSTAGPYPQVAATILPERDGVRRRAHGVSLAHGIWDCDAHQASSCACCLAVQTVTAGASA